MGAPLRLCVVSSGRADWGFLRPVVEGLRADAGFVGQLVLTGTHADARFGAGLQSGGHGEFVVDASQVDSPQVDAHVPMRLDGDDSLSVAYASASVLTGMVEALGRLQPDAVLVLGDRYEILAVAQAALLLGLPLIHLSGGDVTEGAMDEGIRHALTKLSHVHLVTHDAAAARVRQMGEEDWRVHVVGSPSLDGLIRAAALSKDGLERLLGRPLGTDNLLVGFHPVTLEADGGLAAFEALLSALSAVPPTTTLWFTRPNADPGHQALNTRLDEWAQNRRHVSVHAALGAAYLPLMARCRAVVGNSSSGLTEAPSLKVPTVNVGIRQQGRLAGDSVIHCAAEADAIRAALQTAHDGDWSGATNPYGDGRSVSRILRVLAGLPDRQTLLRKRFVDRGAA